MNYHHSILYKFVLVTIAVMLTSIILVGYFTKIYFTSYTQEHEEQLVVATSNHIANALQEQLNLIIGNANLVKNDILLNETSALTILEQLQKHMDVPQPFIEDLYYVNYLNNTTISTTGHQLNENSFDKLRSLDQTNNQISHFTPENSSIYSLIYTLIYKMNDTGNPLLCIDINLSELNELMNSLNYNQNISLLIMDESNHIIMSNIKTDYLEYEELYPSLIEHSDSSNISSRRSTNKSNNYYIHSVNLSALNWKLIAYSNTDILSSKSSHLPFVIVGLIAITLIIMFIVTTLLWNKMTSAINQIIREIQKIQNENYGSTLSDVTISELVPIATAFNDMSLELESTINKKIEAERSKQVYEYKALLAQVNPHFLYNSLNSINALLDLNRYEDIRCVNTSIISLLSYSIGKNGQIITIGEEIKLIEQYIAMQKIRYNNRFSLTSSLSKDIMTKDLLHMTLLPLVENSIFHGFPDKHTKDGYIHITGYITKDQKDLILTITDNGVGIAKEKLATLLSRPTTEPLDTHKHRYVRVGIRNVHERLKILYGVNYGLSIFSTLGEGTTVEIRIPNSGNITKETTDENN